MKNNLQEYNDASEHYHEVEYGQGGVARAKEVIMNKIGFNEFIADYLVGRSEKFAIWLADSILKKEIQEIGRNKYDTLKNLNDRSFSVYPNLVSNNYGGAIREILDWLQHPVTPKQNLKELSFDQALEKARDWHQELQVLGGDIDFTEPEKNTILKKYPKNDEGIEYYWVFIPSNYCDLESSRMGHCGRTGYGNNLISLRSVKPYGKGHTISDSHVTIAYGVTDGIFYQVKGKKNNKPAEKYFPFIYDLIKNSINDSINIDFNGFGSEYGDSEDYGYEDMTTEELREIYDLKPSLFNDVESIYVLFDNGVIDLDELTKITEKEPELFSSYGNQMKLYDLGVISEKPSTTFELNYSCDEVYRLLDVKEFSDDIVEKILCGDFTELTDSWDYYYENPSDLVDNLNKENTDRVIDEIVRITGYEKSDVEENGIGYYLNGEDENFPTDDFDNIIRVLASAQNNADQSDYYDYLYKQLESSLEELGEVHSLNDEGVKMTIDLSKYMHDEEIAEAMDRYEFTDIADLFYEEIHNSYGGAIDRPSFNIDDRYSPYGSSEDFNSYVSDTDLEQGYEKGGSLRTKTLNKKTKIKNMKPSQRKLASGGDVNSTGISKEDYFLVVHNWVYFTFNYPHNFVKDAFSSSHLADHLQEKFSSSYKRYGSVGVLMSFWANLDNENRRILSLWIKNNYFSSSNNKSKLLNISDDDYSKIITHWNLFCFNYPIGLIKSVFSFNTEHFENKFLRAYESAGSVGAVNKFFTELDGGNQRLFTDWVYVNYKGISLYANGGDVKSFENIEKVANWLIENSTYYADKSEEQEIDIYDLYDEALEEAENLPQDEFSEILKNMTSLKYAGGGRVTTNDGIIESFLTSDKELKVGNLSTHYNEYDKEILLRNYGTLIAKRKGKNVEITNTKYSKTTTIITNKVKSMALNNRMNVKYVDKFADGGEAGGKWIIEDWAGNHLFKDKVFDSFEDGWGFIYENVKEESEDDGTYDDYYVIQIPFEGFSYKKEEYADGGQAGKWVNYDKNHLINTETGMIVSKGTNLKDIKPKDIKGFEKLGMGRYADGGLVVKNDSDLQEVAKYMTNAVKKHRWDLKDLIHYFEKENNFDYKQRVKIWEEMNGYEMPKTYNNIYEMLKRISEANGSKFADGGEADLDYNEIFNVLKSKIDDAIDDIPNKYESASQFTGEEIEHESRSGFIPYTDGGYQAVWFETLGSLYSSGYNLPTKPLTDEMNRQIDYNLELARESFISDYPEIVEELGEKNIDYNSLVDAGYGDEAEELSNAEMDMMWDDTILMRILANYYNPENSRAKDGKHTIRLFGDVNLESPYHRVGNLDDSHEYEFTFNSIAELESEMNKGLKQVISWFEGEMYNDSEAEMKVRRMEEGGEADDEDDEDEYAVGGKAGSSKFYAVSFWLKDGVDAQNWIKENGLTNYEVEIDEGDEEINGNGYRVNVFDLGKGKYNTLNDLDSVVDIMIEDEEEYAGGGTTKNKKRSRIKLRIIRDLDAFDKHYDEVGFTKAELSLPYQEPPYDNDDWFVTTLEKGIAEQLISDGWVEKYAGGGSVKKDKLEQARDYWKELEGQMTAKQKKFYNELLKRRQPSFEQNFNDSEIAEYINGEIIEQFGVDLGITKYQITGVNAFKLGFKYIAYREAIEEPEFWEEMNEYAEGGELEDWMEEALDSLMEETGSTDLEISYVSDNGNSFYATDNNLEYRVFKSEDDAEDTAIEQVREDLEESPENFNQDWLMNYIDGRDFFEEALNEMNQGYVDDIESESDKKYANRLIAELVENGLMDEEDAKSDYAEPMADDLKSDYIALLTEGQLDEGNNGLDYFISNFGESETYKMVIDNNLIDIDEASKDAVNVDGIGHFLSSYDGETLYLSNDCVAYRTN